MLLFHIIFYKVVKSLWVDIYVIKYEGRDDKAVEHLFADQHVKGSFRNWINACHIKEIDNVSASCFAV